MEEDYIKQIFKDQIINTNSLKETEKSVGTAR